jgi:hypothetical protein
MFAKLGPIVLSAGVEPPRAQSGRRTLLLRLQFQLCNQQAVAVFGTESLGFAAILECFDPTFI